MLDRFLYGQPFGSMGVCSARFHGDSRLAIFDLTASSLKSTSSVSIRSVGKLKDNKYRSVADSGASKRIETQLSRRSPSLSFSLFVFASLVDGIFR